MVQDCVDAFQVKVVEAKAWVTRSDFLQAPIHHALMAVEAGV